MFEKVKVVKITKDDVTTEVEIYSDECSDCGKEMVAEKAAIDTLKLKIPILFEKIKTITFCQPCMLEKVKKDPEYKLFSDEDMEEIKEKVSVEDLRNVFN